MTTNRPTPFPHPRLPDTLVERLPAISRRFMIGAGAAGLILPRFARAQTAPSGNGPSNAINVSGAHNAPIPIALPAFTNASAGTSEVGDQIAQVITSDLDHCGLFRSIDQTSFVPNSLANGVPVWNNWSILGAQALVTGNVTDQGGGQVRVEYRLWGIAQQKQLQGTAYTTTANNWRRIAHIIADDIYQQLIGEKGYFDTRVAYISVSGPPTSPTRRMAIMDYDGANTRFLTSGRWMALSPQFNPTRQQLAFVSFESNRPRVFLFDLQSGARSMVGDFGEMSIGPRFSPDGASLLLSVTRGGGAMIVRYDLGSRRITQLTDANSINVTPSYSPDGSKIVFNSDRDGSGDQQLFVMGADGSNVQRISYGSGRYAEPDWSPTGDMIAFTKLGSGGFGIGVMKPDGSGERILSQGYLEEGASFCPNGRVIMFYRQTPLRVGNVSHLVTIGTDGFNERITPTPTNATDPSWGPLLS
ncbi:Tol-Pal system beta propeller repeat protein TolB [Acidiphilium sp. AL]|uniref:Tol-Pal system beta propeller repeat protein TolB n=1 Tax=Acidiphilium sp. AL TaxID=2871704 RepID=UPI0021CAF016|nr:Tol-Pal system beta propeller repeat protein TolB [Acidiphilium sp. AL]MCU4161003.1 Tol-Pal system beta propeller repeat protein TolB [Acidiphilium sp. AL]